MAQRNDPHAFKMQRACGCEGPNEVSSRIMDRDRLTRGAKRIQNLCVLSTSHWLQQGFVGSKRSSEGIPGQAAPMPSARQLMKKASHSRMLTCRLGRESMGWQAAVMFLSAWQKVAPHSCWDLTSRCRPCIRPRRPLPARDRGRKSTQSKNRGPPTA
jgi:hypothetical protein